MFQLPSVTGVSEVVVDEASVNGSGTPKLLKVSTEEIPRRRARVVHSACCASYVREFRFVGLKQVWMPVRNPRKQARHAEILLRGHLGVSYSSCRKQATLRE